MAHDGYRGDPYRRGTTAPTLRTDGVLSRRVFAYLVDLLVIGLLILVLGLLVLVSGFVTFGLGWALYAILVPATAILYSGVTIGGPAQATVGMRFANLVVVDGTTGSPIGFSTACVHAFLFYLSLGTVILALSVLIGIARGDNRLGHDLVTGVLVARRW